MAAESLNFSEVGVREMYNKLINTLHNVFEFYLMFLPLEAEYKLEKAGELSDYNPTHILDKWILAKLQVLIKEVTEGMNDYKLVEASRPIVDFVTELSQWYVRRSRDRFKGDDKEDKSNAHTTLKIVLNTLAKVMAPFTPFIAEKIYLGTNPLKESVHLEDWPEVNEKLIDDELLEAMELGRKSVEAALALRAKLGIKVRQPLNKLIIYYQQKDGIRQIIADEVNVKSVEFSKDEVEDKSKVDLDSVITEELKKEGLLREIVRTVNQIRKEQKLTISDRVSIKYQTKDKLLQDVFVEYKEEIKKSVLADVVEEAEGGEEKEIDDMKLNILVEKL